jgi:2-succinyl-5-enolpyruvyl-6-hydroxy-3-cyclohexene-1-carboxylate synthase
MTSGPDVQAALVATFVDEWVRAGVTDAVVAPGSRSTPVLDALAVDGRIRLHVVVDERSAGFVALGLGLATGRPAPIVTTSGTAAVELHPAVVEAHQAGVPLLAVTADRPAELHDVGAPQTVDQVGLYGAAPRWAVTIGVADDAGSSSWRSLASRSVADTMWHQSGPGPVHVNLELREPLLGRPGTLPAGRGDGAPWHLVGGGVGGAPSDATVALLSGAAGSRGLIVTGEGAPPPAIVLALASTLGWPVMADARSGCRVPHPLVVGAADSLLRVPSIAALRPDLVLRLGRPWASKVMAQWLAALGGGVIQILVDPTGSWADPERQVAVVERCDPGVLCEAVLHRAGGVADPIPTRWAGIWHDAEAAAQAAIDRQLGSEPAVTEAAVARAVVGALPAGATLMVSSSMPVRDVEWWGAARTGLRVLANRGANGIDGVVSTAIGVAIGAGSPTTALVGDLAFLYDAGALLGVTDRDISLTLVVVDNRGGGIFSFLPQATGLPPERFERLWGTPHAIDIVALAAAYGVSARQVHTIEDLRRPCEAAAPGVEVVVVTTERQANVAAHERLQRAVAAAVSSPAGPGT